MNRYAMLSLILGCSAMAAAADIEVPGYPSIPNPTGLGERAAIILYLDSELHLANLDHESKAGLLDIYRTVIDAQRRSAKKPTGTGKLTIEAKRTVAEGGAPHPLVLGDNARLVDKDGKAVPAAAVADRPYVMLYFSAHWCPPCRAFTPTLVAYANAHAEAYGFNVVLISADHLPEDMKGYMQDTQMPWPAYPWGSAKAADMERRFTVTGIPRLIVLDQDDGPVLDSGRDGPDEVLRRFTNLVKDHPRP